MLRIYDSLERREVDFVPLVSGRVRMYVCGITVYDYCHVGHARFLVVFDILARWLRHLGYDVTYVRNITDIDDKIIRRAAENGEPIDTLTERFITAMNEDCAALGMLNPTHEPRATEHIGNIIRMIEALVERGYAYRAANGDVYYRVGAFEGYGRLSGKRIDELRVGARVEVDEAKEDPLDFVLWKAAKPGEPQWASPWGPGRPGWHIECSAMSTALLGTHFDLHGGGMDLQFPHHENEIAQSCAATGAPFAEHWMHNGFVQVNQEKMSKSLGNFFTVRDVLKEVYPDELRWFIVASHYRSPLNYSDQEFVAARAALTRLYTALRGVEPSRDDAATSAYAERFEAAMNADLNTPEALAVLFDIARDLNRAKESGETAKAGALAARMKDLAGLLGLLGEEPEAWLKRPARPGGGTLDDAAVAALVAERNAARASKDWKRADSLRKQLADQGIVLEDSAGTTTWRRG
jgi:cysteinyl-tRNA synthetase